MRKRTLLSWSSGKDSAWALHVLQQDPGIEIVGLFTTVNKEFSRVSMHATRRELLQRQAEAAGLPIDIIHLPDPCTNEDYESIMATFISECLNKGILYFAFGDLFLEDIRRYRENQLKGTGIEPLFPLWGIPSKELAEQMLSAGLKAYISSIDLTKLPAHFAGQRWTKELIARFPEGCDPCGENGEFHTVVVGGPMLRETIPVRIGDIVTRDGFAYADIILSP